MKKVTLGHTGIQISQMGFGNSRFGTSVPKDTAFEILDRFVAGGGNFIDTSNNYAVFVPGGKGGECETVIGEWMKSRGNRDQIVLATKVGANPRNLAEVIREDGSLIDDWHLHREGLSAEAITKAVEGSLRRLQTNYIDLYYAHVEDPKVDPMETLQAFDALHREGKVRSIGCSNHRTWRLERAKQVSRQNNLIEYCCTQDLHTLLKPLPSRRPLYATEEKLDYLKANADMTLVAYTPTLWGKYAHTDKYNDPGFWAEFYSTETSSRLHALTEVARARGATEIQIVYAWMMQGAPSAVPIVCTDSMEQLEENLAAARITLSDDELKRLG